MKHLFARKQGDEDFSKFLGEQPQTRKQRLLLECEKHGISICRDDPTEQSASVYAELRATASEVELEQRLNARKAVSQAKCANAIAVIALIVSVVALIKSFF